MPAQWFNGYGLLDYLEPQFFYTGDWMWSTTREAQNGEVYDLVFNRERHEYRYTRI